jgi:signal transduction histidine kinase
MSDNMLRSLGSVFENRALYGPTHNVTIQSLESAFEAISQCLATDPTLLFTITPDECNLNNRPAGQNVPIIGQFIDRLRAHEVSTLTLKQDMGPDEFIALVELIAQDPAQVESEGGFAAKLETSIFLHIESRKVTFVELAEEEVVVNNTELQGDPAEQEERAASVMAYLGVHEDEQPSAPSATVTDNIQKLLDAPSDLGALIVQSAGTSLAMDLPINELLSSDILHHLVERIVTRLERTFNILKTSKSARSQKGKKSLIKSLTALKTSLSVVVPESVTPNKIDLAPISTAIEAMTDELAIDALASEYLRKRKLIQASEDRLLRYIARQGETINDSDLKTKLMEGGLSPWNWETLLLTSGTKSSANNAQTEASQHIPEFKHLHDMLAQLAECFSDVNQNSSLTPDEIKGLITQVEERMGKLIENTRKRMEKLENQVSHDASTQTIEGVEHTQKQSRRQLLELIAEIVQELCQPLSVIQCSFDVLLTGQLDVVSPAQHELLSMASRGAKRLDLLIHDLVTIVGHPSDMVPKERTKGIILE